MNDLNILLFSNVNLFVLRSITFKKFEFEACILHPPRQPHVTQYLMMHHIFFIIQTHLQRKQHDMIGFSSRIRRWGKNLNLPFMMQCWHIRSSISVESSRIERIGLTQSSLLPGDQVGQVSGNSWVARLSATWPVNLSCISKPLSTRTKAGNPLYRLRNRQHWNICGYATWNVVISGIFQLSLATRIPKVASVWKSRLS